MPSIVESLAMNSKILLSKIRIWKKAHLADLHVFKVIYIFIDFIYEKLSILINTANAARFDEKTSFRF